MIYEYCSKVYIMTRKVIKKAGESLPVNKILND